MIISVVSDVAWLEKLESLPEWRVPLLPALVLAPHPDDETLGAGALIATLRAYGVPVIVVAATDGENCYNTPTAAREKLRTIRQNEQCEALARLGVAAENLHRLHLADSGLHRCEDQLTAMLMDLAEPGMHMVAPWIGDFHPDHEACARAATTVAKAKGLTLTSYFFWTWHRGEVSLLDALPARRFVPDQTALQAKSAALQCHRSQLEHGSGEPILPSNLLGPAAWPFEVFLPA